MKRTALTIITLLLAPLAVLHACRALPEHPSFGRIHAGFSQAWEDRGAITSNAWN